METDLHNRLAACERANRRTRLFLLVIVTALIVSTGFAQRDPQQSQVTGILKVAELVIVDDKGVERVRLGGQLPDAVINGKRVPRGEEAAGIILYDDTGQERSGYVTLSPSGNVVLTLDTRKQQVALFAAGPDDGATARLWRGEDWVEMRTDESGARFSIGRSNELVVQQPPMSEAEASVLCSSLMDEVNQLKEKPPVEAVLQACKQRMTDAACRKCLGLQ